MQRFVRHRASKKFWAYYNLLPKGIQKLADKAFELLKSNPRHASLRFKRVGRFWSARIGIYYRAVAVQEGNDYVWFWIGRHDEYDQLIKGK